MLLHFVLVDGHKSALYNTSVTRNIETSLTRLIRWINLVFQSYSASHLILSFLGGKNFSKEAKTTKGKVKENFEMCKEQLIKCHIY